MYWKINQSKNKCKIGINNKFLKNIALTRHVEKDIAKSEMKIQVS